MTKISELITVLEGIKSRCGDLTVKRSGYSGATDLNLVWVKEQNMKILTKRESRPEYWNTWYGEERRGELVVSI